MHGGQHAVADAERLVEHLGDGGQAVRRARRVGDDVVALGVVGGFEVDPQRDGDVGLLGRRGDDDLLRARLEMLGGPGAVAEAPGGFDDHVGADVAPRQRGGSLSANTGISAAVDADGAVEHLDCAREGPVDRVVAQQVREHLDVHHVIDADPLEVGALLVRRSERRASGAAEAVDADSCVHAHSVGDASRVGIPRDHVSASVVPTRVPRLRRSRGDGARDRDRHRAPRRLDRARAARDDRGCVAAARLPRVAVRDVALVPLLQRGGEPRRGRPQRRGAARRAGADRAAGGHGRRARHVLPRDAGPCGGRLRGGRRLAWTRDRDGAARPPRAGRPLATASARSPRRSCRRTTACSGCSTTPASRCPRIDPREKCISSSRRRCRRERDGASRRASATRASRRSRTSCARPPWR